jgi:hypothetical protein
VPPPSTKARTWPECSRSRGDGTLTDELLTRRLRAVRSGPIRISRGGWSWGLCRRWERRLSSCRPRRKYRLTRGRWRRAGRPSVRSNDGRSKWYGMRSAPSRPGAEPCCGRVAISEGGVVAPQPPISRLRRRHAGSDPGPAGRHGCAVPGPTPIPPGLVAAHQQHGEATSDAAHEAEHASEVVARPWVLCEPRPTRGGPDRRRPVALADGPRDAVHSVEGVGKRPPGYGLTAA